MTDFRNPLLSMVSTHIIDFYRGQCLNLRAGRNLSDESGILSCHASDNKSTIKKRKLLCVTLYGLKKR